MLLPVLGFVWMTLMQETPGADWWQYMAAPGIFACIAAGVAVASRKSQFTTALFAGVMVLLFLQTWRRAAIYESMESYCLAVTAEDPYAWTLENNLGIMLKRQGLFAQAEECYRQALRDNPAYIEADINMANAFAAAGDPAGAEASFRAALQQAPRSIGLRISLCQALLAQGKKEAALQVCDQVDQLARASGDPTALTAAKNLRQACNSPP
jgi:tetratricopeptide (TPR) repeat protein